MNLEEWLFRIIIASILIAIIVAFCIVLEYRLFLKQFKKNHPQVYKNVKNKL